MVRAQQRACCIMFGSFVVARRIVCVVAGAGAVVVVVCVGVGAGVVGVGVFVGVVAAVVVVVVVGGGGGGVVGVGVGVGLGGVGVCVCVLYGWSVNAACSIIPQFQIFKNEAVGYIRGLSICFGWGVFGYMAHARR